MVRTLVCALAIVGLLAVPAMAEGVQKGQFELSIGAGLSLPMGDFNDLAETGFGLDIEGGYYVSPQFALIAEISARQFGIPDSAKISGVDINWNINDGVFGAKYLFMPKNTSPYLKAGFGFFDYELEFSSGSASATFSDSDAGITAGGGVQFKGQGKVGGFVEVMYNNIFISDTDPDAPDNLTSLDIRGGVTFFFGGPKP